MARRRRGRPLDGILVLDKPAGLSSNQALQMAKRLYFAAKAGHTGSLDPLATGVLPLCFGEATKFSQYLLDADKAYDSTFVLGVATETGDAEGAVIETRDASNVTLAALELELEAFRGEIEQVPSMFSAIKQDGKPLYKLAREGKEVERKATSFAAELLKQDIGKGDEVLAAGTRLQPQHLGLAASVGQARLSVRRRLKVALFASGDELVMPGHSLTPGKIYNSNLFTATGLLRALGCEVIELGIVGHQRGQDAQRLVACCNAEQLVIVAQVHEEGRRAQR